MYDEMNHGKSKVDGSVFSLGFFVLHVHERDGGFNGPEQDHCSNEEHSPL